MILYITGLIRKQWNQQAPKISNKTALFCTCGPFCV